MVPKVVIENLNCALTERKLSLRKQRVKLNIEYKRYVIGLCVAAFFLFSNSGCCHNGRPRLRLGAYFGAPLGIAYPNPDNLGKHSYTNMWGESIGLLYTCKGGFIDLGHVRDSADRAAYCSRLAYKSIIEGKKEFSFRLMEPSKYSVSIKYPENWDSRNDKEKIARDISINVGKYLAYNSMVWHEMITWYGYRYTIFFSEYISSFSWEDLYSDIVGTEIAGRALEEDANDYDSVMTKLIDAELNRLNVKPVSIARKAEKKVKGKWFDGIIYPFAKLNKRNFDIGIDDGYVTPWLVPGICDNTEPVSYAVPGKDFLSEYGFKIDVKIKPKIMVQHKILKVAYPDGKGKYIVPSEHFPVILKDIIEKEKIRNGPQVDLPNL